MVCPPLSWCGAQGACAGPCFCSRLFESGSWVFWSLCIFGSRIGPNCSMHTLNFSPIQFLCILLLQERCVQVQALQQRVPGPSKRSQVPACLTMTDILIKSGKSGHRDRNAQREDDMKRHREKTQAKERGRNRGPADTMISDLQVPGLRDDELLLLQAT